MKLEHRAAAPVANRPFDIPAPFSQRVLADAGACNCVRGHLSGLLCRTWGPMPLSARYAQRIRRAAAAFARTHPALKNDTSH